jgi:ssDNA-binding Zn-finger/Zn-ribbon topoisomerase 1
MVKAILRSGVRFNCPECGRLWKDDPQHAESRRKACPKCSGDLQMVARGEDPMLVGDAKWFRCTGCFTLYMHRRGELVPAQPRAGFREFTEIS